MSKLKKTTVYDVAKGLATWIAENANGGLTLVELACESGYFADLNTSEIREQITRDLEAHVVGRLVNLHGWAKVQRLEDGRKATRFYPPSARMVTAEPPAPTGYTREGVIAWLLTNSLEGVNPRVASRIYANAGQRRKRAVRLEQSGNPDSRAGEDRRTPTEQTHDQKAQRGGLAENDCSRNVL